jgi:hypothetical protein
MKVTGIVQSFILLALALVLVTPTAFACDPDDEVVSCRDQRRVARPRAEPKPVAMSKAAPKPVATSVANARRGGSPYDALAPTDSWQTLEAGASVWYKMGDGIDRQHLDIWLDAYGKGGIGFAVYAPDQMNDLSSNPPKGRGAYNKAEPSHDLYWSGQAPAGGTWYALVTNYNSFAVSYKLGYNRVITGRREGCSAPYWEWLGAHVNAWVLWPGFCP